MQHLAKASPLPVFGTFSAIQFSQLWFDIALSHRGGA